MIIIRESQLFITELGTLFCYESEELLTAFLVWGVREDKFIDWLDK